MRPGGGPPMRPGGPPRPGSFPQRPMQRPTRPGGPGALPSPGLPPKAEPGKPIYERKPAPARARPTLEKRFEEGERKLHPVRARVGPGERRSARIEPVVVPPRPPREITITEGITVRDLAEKLDVRAKDPVRPGARRRRMGLRRQAPRPRSIPPWQRPTASFRPRSSGSSDSLERCPSARAFRTRVRTCTRIRRWAWQLLDDARIVIRPAIQSSTSSSGRRGVRWPGVSA